MPRIILNMTNEEILKAIDAEYNRLGELRDQHLKMAKTYLKQQEALTDTLEEFVKRLEEEDTEVEPLAE